MWISLKQIIRNELQRLGKAVKSFLICLGQLWEISQFNLRFCVNEKPSPIKSFSHQTHKSERNHAKKHRYETILLLIIIAVVIVVIVNHLTLLYQTAVAICVTMRLDFEIHIVSHALCDTYELLGQPKFQHPIMSACKSLLCWEKCLLFSNALLVTIEKYDDWSEFNAASEQSRKSWSVCQTFFAEQATPSCKINCLCLVSNIWSIRGNHAVFDGSLIRIEGVRCALILEQKSALSLTSITADWLQYSELFISLNVS